MGRALGWGGRSTPALKGSPGSHPCLTASHRAALLTMAETAKLQLFVKVPQGGWAGSPGEEHAQWGLAFWGRRWAPEAACALDAGCLWRLRKGARTGRGPGELPPRPCERKPGDEAPQWGGADQQLAAKAHVGVEVSAAGEGSWAG